MSLEEHLKNILKQESMNRRHFMGMAAALGASSALASSVFASSAFAATPKQGGHFKIGMSQGSTTDSLDPATTLHTGTQIVNHALYNYLTEVNGKGELIGELAESWDASPDAKVWTMKLRKDVTFHNGKAMTAEDVIASLNHHRGKDSKSAAKPIVEPITELVAEGDHAVKITLSGGNADFPFLMSDYHLAILPSKDGKIDPTAGVGSGAFILEKLDPGVNIKMKHNPNYWKEGRGHFDSVEIVVIADVAARTNALTTGAVHAMDRCDLKTVHLLKRAKGITVTKADGNQHYTLPMNCTVGPFDNVDVRLALKYGINREELVKTILHGYGAVGNDHPIGSSQLYFNKELEQRKYDPDKAKFHLKKAGMDNLKVSLSASDAAFSGAVDSAVLYKESAAKGGIDINVNRVPADGYWSNVWMKDAWCMSYWGGRPTEDWMFSQAYAADAKWNESYWKNDKFNKLLLAARAELDTSKRRQMYGEMQELVRDDGGSVIPMFASYVGALSDKVGHDQIAANWDLDGLRCLERWWLV
ncbi:MAG: ABC transporter substrate-binding protein [Alphaproteobacteria bacterium]|nr:MAG: ABC transporter substrate-binding protein [Alphaproteobacteria bacterium]